MSYGQRAHEGSRPSSSRCEESFAPSPWCATSPPTTGVALIVTWGPALRHPQAEVNRRPRQTHGGIPGSAICPDVFPFSFSNIGKRDAVQRYEKLWARSWHVVARKLGCRGSPSRGCSLPLPVPTSGIVPPDAVATLPFSHDDVLFLVHLNGTFQPTLTHCWSEEEASPSRGYRMAYLGTYWDETISGSSTTGSR